MRSNKSSFRSQLFNGPACETEGTTEELLDAAKSDFRLAEQTLERVRRTFKQNASTQEQVDQARESHSATISAVVVRQEELNLLESGTRKEDIRQIEAQLAASEADLALRTTGYRTEDIAVTRFRKTLG